MSSYLNLGLSDYRGMHVHVINILPVPGLGFITILLLNTI